MLTCGRTDAERKKFTDDLPRLQRTRALARRQVHEAKKHRRRLVSSRQIKLEPRPSVQVRPNKVLLEPAWRHDDNKSTYQACASGAGFSDDGHNSALEDDEPLIFHVIDDLEREFEARKAEGEERKADKERERKIIQDEAVQIWKDQQLREVEVCRQKIEDEQSSLRVELTKQRLAPQQIEDIVSHVHTQEQIHSDLHLLSLTPASDKALSDASGDGPAKATSSRQWLIWPRKYVRKHFFSWLSVINPYIENRAQASNPLQQARF